MAFGLYGGILYDASIYDGASSPPLGNPILNLTTFTRTLLQGAVLAAPLTFPSPAPLQVSPATATLLSLKVVTEPGSP